jgi:hypothetical protein
VTVVFKMMRMPSMTSYFGQRTWESSETTEEDERIEGTTDQQEGERRVKDQEEDAGTPAALHKQYSPPQSQRLASDVPYHGEAALEYVLLGTLTARNCSFSSSTFFLVQNESN